MTSLEALIEPYPGISLTSSRELYPNAEGAGLPLIEVQTPLCRAVIALQGAQLLEFHTAEGTPLIWLSPNCRFEPGKALRGGIPICLPWFGPHPENRDLPQHGFARTSNWELTQLAQSDDGRTELWFELRHQPDARCPQAFTAELRLVLGQTIEQELTLHNRDDKDFDCTWALHSYFPASASDQVSVPVLAERDYLDNLEQHARHTQSGPLRFNGEVDRVFPDVQAPITLQDKVTIRIEQERCPSVITWNPGAEKAANMADLGKAAQRAFVCIERGAVLGEGWRLTPDERRSGKIVISLD